MEQTLWNSRSPATPVSLQSRQNVQQTDRHLKQTSSRRQQRRTACRASREGPISRQEAGAAALGLGASLIDAAFQPSSAAAADLVAQVTLNLPNLF